MIQHLPLPLAARLGAELRRHRERGSRSQEEIAAVARDFGYRTWTRGTVAMIESGRRRLSLDEFFTLPMMLRRLGIDATLASLLGDAGVLALNTSTTVSVETLHAMLTGRTDSKAVAIPLTGTLWTADEVDEVRRVWRQAGGRGDATPERLDALVRASQGGAEQHAAVVLKTTPLVVAMLADKTWGRSLTAERDARVAERFGPDELAAVHAAESGHGAVLGLPTPFPLLTTVAAHRGHVTRELMEELRATRSRRRSRKGKRG